MKNRTIIGIICIVLSIAVMFGISPLVNTVASGKIEVVQVNRRIEPGQMITAEDCIKVEIGSFGIKETVITDETLVAGKFAAATIVPDNCIYPDMLSEDSDTADNIFRQLDGSQQAMSITIHNFAGGLSGKLQNGDIVSVVVVTQEESIIPPELTYVRVITTTTSKGTDSDKLEEKEDGTSDAPATVTLLLTPAQAQLLAFHDQTNTVYLSLVYRGDAHTADSFLAAQSEMLRLAAEAAEAARAAEENQEGTSEPNPEEPLPDDTDGEGGTEPHYEDIPENEAGEIYG